MGRGLRHNLWPVVLVVAAAIALAIFVYWSTLWKALSGDVTGIATVGNATLSLPTDVVRQNSTIPVSASGFLPGETVVLRAKVGTAPTRDFASAKADANGSVARVQVPLPEWLTSGLQRTEAVGKTSGRRAEAVLRVRAKGLWINLKDHSAKQGSKLGMIAGGFQPGESVKVFLLPQEGSKAEPVQIGTLKADEVGNTAWAEFQVPVVPDDEPANAAASVGGAASENQTQAQKPDWWQQPLALRGAASGLELKEIVTINRLKPTVKNLSPWYGPPGGSLNINAQGFLPNEKVQVEFVLAGKAQPIGTFQADQYGGLWGAGPIKVPYDTPSGDLKVRLTGEQSHLPVETKYGVVAPKPWVELSSWSGYPGTGVIFSGGGWAADERVVAHLGSAAGPVVAEGTADGQGFLHGLGPTTVPEVPPDPLAKPDAPRKVTYTLVGERSRTQASAVFALIIPFFDLPPTPPPAQLGPSGQPLTEPPAAPSPAPTP